MYTAADFKLMRRICPDEMNDLLNNLGIKIPDFNSKDEFEIYSELDEEIDAKISAKLKSNSVLEGYTKLLDAGGIDFKLSETRIELLKKIIANREKILKGASAQEKNSAQTSENTPAVAIVGGIILICAAGYFAMSDEPNTIIAIVGVVLGIAGIIFGMNGNKKNVATQPQGQISRQEFENILPILIKVDRIFDTI